MNKRISVMLFVFLLFFTVSGFAGNGRFGNDIDYSKYKLTDFEISRFSGVLSGVSTGSSVIVIGGTIVDVVENLKLKDQILKTDLSDKSKRSLVLGCFKKGHTVDVTAFKFPNGAYVAASILLIDDTEKKMNVHRSDLK